MVPLLPILFVMLGLFLFNLVGTNNHCDAAFIKYIGNTQYIHPSINAMVTRSTTGNTDICGFTQSHPIFLQKDNDDGKCSSKLNRITLDFPQDNNRRRILKNTAFLFSTMVGTMSANIQNSSAFEGGVGGLGKTRPETGVVFSNTDLNDSATAGGIIIDRGSDGRIGVELFAPDGVTPAFVSFKAPWPMMKSSGIESRDISNPDSAFIQVASISYGGVELKDPFSIPSSFFSDTLFSKSGKYGMYGTPTDVKVKRVKVQEGQGESGKALYIANFTTLTPSMRESERKAFIAASVVGDGVFMLVASTTSARFKGQESLLRQVVDSFDCVQAPKSSLRR
mmetsp:Transcript_14733/g.21043  ORF Transcript_14733/g.21043 Transcript_14733/m.21043 type:complete len:337 (+) Transcript_14733:57-1067(+)